MVIIKDHFPLPLIDEQLDRLQNVNIFGTIDLKNVFFHGAVAESSRKYTSPPGDINVIFRPLTQRDIALPYLDDVVIPSSDKREALLNLKEVIKTCEEYGLELNMKKCAFLQTRIKFLGHIIENRKLYPSTEKIDAVVMFPNPQTLKQLQSFVGLSGYFRKLIPKYARIANPLTDMTRKDTKIET